jgi:hypothetical protein
VTNDAIYGLSPDSKAVYQWSGSNSWWVQVGGPAAFLWGGGFGMFATTPDSTGISRYLGTQFNWQFLGSFAAPPQIANTYAVTGNSLYAMSKFGRVFRWDLNRGWVVDLPTEQLYSNLYGGGLGVFGLTSGGHLWRINTGGPPIAGPDTSFAPGHDVVVADNALYAGSPLRDSVWKWSGQGTNWTKIGNFGFWQLVACP